MVYSLDKQPDSFTTTKVLTDLSKRFKRSQIFKYDVLKARQIYKHFIPGM